MVEATTKPELEWSGPDQSGDYRAEYKGLVLLAERDECPSNPFEDQDGHWPMLVYYNKSRYAYDVHRGAQLCDALDRFNDAQLVHDQVAIAQALGIAGNDAATPVQKLIFDFAHAASADDDPLLYDEQGEPRRYVHDGGELRYMFDRAQSVGDTPQLDVLKALHDILGIPCLRHSSRGYSQGDWAELLIAATPEAQEDMRSKPDGMTDEAWAETLDADMKAQAKLYDAWAWGDVYGFKVCRSELDEDGEETLEELDSCWGFYGADFAESGLTEAVLDAARGYVEEKEDA